MTYKTDNVGNDLSIMELLKVAMDAGNRVSVYAAGNGSASVTIEKPEPREAPRWMTDEQGYLRCSECGARSPYRSVFCPECGEKLMWTDGLENENGTFLKRGGENGEDERCVQQIPHAGDAI